MTRLSLVALILPALSLAQTVPTYTVTTIAGTGVGGFSGDGGAATSAQIDGPLGLFLDSKNVLYFADQLNNNVRTITSGTIATIAGTNKAGYDGDNKAATSAVMNGPAGVFQDSKGNIYITDSQNNVVRMIASGTITTFAGNQQLGFGFGGDGGKATAASMFAPSGVVADAAGTVYIADTKNNPVRKVVATIISAFAGNGTVGFSGDGGPATQAHLTAPSALAIDANGTVYIADTGSNKIRRVTSGVIDTVAGNQFGASGFSGDGGQAVSATLNHPGGVAVDACGNLYIADTTNNRIRIVTTTGVISTIAGNGKFGYTGDGGAALSAQFGFPTGLAVDSNGKVYIADTQNNVIRLLTPNSAVPCGLALPSIKSAGVISAGDFGAFPAVAPGSWIEIYGTNLAATTRTWSSSDFVGVNAPTSLDRTTVTIGGQAAFIDYVSPTQVNAQVPSTVGSGLLPLTVSTSAGTSTPYAVTTNLTQPGLFAPASFVVGGKQYVGATLTDGVTYIAPVGSIPGRTSRPAKPGETIILYGVGFGAVNTGIPAGQIVQQANSLVLPIQISFGSTPAVLQYFGLAGNFVGLYEFYAVVPNVADNDLVPLTFTLNGAAGTQTLYTAVKK